MIDHFTFRRILLDCRRMKTSGDSPAGKSTRPRLRGREAATPDLAAPFRPADFAFPVHYTLLSEGVLIAEHVTNLDSLAGHRIEAMFLGLNIAGSDGAPVRAVARAVD